MTAILLFLTACGGTPTVAPEVTTFVDMPGPELVGETDHGQVDWTDWETCLGVEPAPVLRSDAGRLCAVDDANGEVERLHYSFPTGKGSEVRAELSSRYPSAQVPTEEVAELWPGHSPSHAWTVRDDKVHALAVADGDELLVFVYRR